MIDRTATPALPLRVATAADGPAIEAVMKASARELGAGFYAPSQVPSFVAHVALLDPVLIADGTYFVIEDGAAIAACGGWSDRKKLFSGGGAAADDTARLTPGVEPARIRAMFVHPAYARRGLGRQLLAACEAAARAAGFTVAELMSTAPGEPLYRACGYQVLEAVDLVLPDGVVLAGARMHKPLGAAAITTGSRR